MVLIPLSQNKFAMVDDEDAELAGQIKWFLRREPRADGTFREYAYSRTGKKLHRHVMGAPSGVKVDHRNGNGLDCRRENLRLCSDSENAHNKPAPRGGTSRFKGVSWHKAAKKWIVRVAVGGVRTMIGFFDDETEAARAYDAAAVSMHGEFARTNVMEGLL